MEPFAHTVQLPGRMVLTKPVWCLCPESYRGPWMRAGWRRELGAGDRRELISGLQLPGPKEVIRSRFNLRSVFSASVGNPGMERGTEGGRKGSKLGALDLYRLPGWVLGLCVCPLPFLRLSSVLSPSPATPC